MGFKGLSITIHRIPWRSGKLSTFTPSKKATLLTLEELTCHLCTLPHGLSKAAKLKDLKELLCYVPPIHHAFYNNLAACDEAEEAEEAEEDEEDED